MKRSLGGRPRHDFWQTENFIPVQKEGKTIAYCSVCNNYLKNISKVRLQMHRKNCYKKSDSVLSEIQLESDSETNIEQSTISNADLQGLNSVTVFSKSKAISSICQLKLAPKKDKTLETKNLKIQSFFDNISDKDEDRINEALIKFFCSCNVPFEAVESEYFLNLMKSLRPAYKPPTKEKLSNCLLYNLYNQLITNNSSVINCDGILIIKKTPQNTQILTFIKTVQRKIFYLKSWDISCNLEEIVNEALDIVKTKYSITIYCVITDEDQTLKRQNNLWFVKCNLLFATSLEQVLWDKDLVDKVRYLLDEFSELKENLLKRGGAKIILSNTNTCDNLHDMYASCKNNLAVMRQITGEGIYKLRKVIVDILFDETFEQELQDSLELYGLISSILEKCKKLCTTFADIIEEWLILESLNNNLIYRIQPIISEIITPIALASNFCHPNYRGERFINDKNRLTKMTEFFIDALDVKGLTDYEAYRSSRGIFGKLKSKECHDPQIFWDTVMPFHSDLATVAIKLLQIPASVIPMKTRITDQNDLTPDRLQKLTDIYYELNICDKHVSNE